MPNLLLLAFERRLELDATETENGLGIKALQVKASTPADNPVLEQYCTTPGGQHWGFERFPELRVKRSGETKLLVRYADHSRGTTQEVRPALLPETVWLLDQVDIPWPRYQVDLTPKLEAGERSYIPPSITSMRLEQGEDVRQLVLFTDHRNQAKEWEPYRVFSSSKLVLGRLYYFNHLNHWVQDCDPRIDADYIKCVGKRGYSDLIPFTARVYILQWHCAANAINSSLPFLPWKCIIAIHVSRETLFEDSYRQVINKMMGFQLRRKLTVKFIGEPGVDARGCFRDWIKSVGDDFVNFKSTDCQLFESDPIFGYIVSKWAAGDSHILPFFRFFGRFVGICLVHGYQLNFELSELLLRQIKCETITARDLKRDNGFMNGLRYVHDMQTDEELQENDVMFAETLGGGNGRLIMVNFIPGGNTKYVTTATQAEYLCKRIFYRIGGDKSIIDAIRQGIDEVLPISFLGLFTAIELGRLLSGKKERIKVTDWIKATEYMPAIQPKNHSRDEKIVGWFWQIVRIFTIEAQYKLLSFWYGIDRLSLGGISNYNFEIEISGSTNRLPTSSTCFGSIKLRPYETKQILFDRLTKAIYGNVGFGKA